MKILIFEFITGGGLNFDDVSKNLFHEGEKMVQALLTNFATVPQHDVILFQAQKNVEIEFQQQIKKVDAVWIIAPEFEGILERFCYYVEKANKLLLTSPAKAVTLTANKLTTFQILEAAKIKTIPTEIYQPKYHYDQTREWIIKPIDGAGSNHTFLLTHPKDWTILPSFKKIAIIQPHEHGDKISLSCLFNHGSAKLLCINLQIFTLIQQQPVLNHIEVNYKIDAGHYQQLVTQIAHAFPDLWGYVGIDLIENNTDCWVLEINPRLTTSFVEIEKKCGLNIAELVLNLSSGIAL